MEFSHVANLGLEFPMKKGIFCQMSLMSLIDSYIEKLQMLVNYKMHVCVVRDASTAVAPAVFETCIGL